MSVRRRGENDPEPDRKARIRRKPATIRDVARAAGVAPSTVSYVLNNQALVADKTRQHILRVIQTLDYRPNKMARNLRSGLSAAAGLIVPDMTNPFFSMIAQGAQAAAQAADVLTVLCTTDGDFELEDYYARVVQSRRLDGLLYLSGSGVPSEPLLELVRSGRVVLVDERLPGVDACAVVGTNRRGARDIASFALAEGHRHLAIINGPPVLWTSEQRLAGFREAIAAAGIGPDDVPVSFGDYTERSGFMKAQAILTLPKHRRPTVVLCGNDMMAFGFMRAAREQGVAIPADMSVTGFDDVPISSLAGPPLTTVSLPAQEMGQRAMRMLLSNLVAPREHPVIEECDTALVVRGSVSGPS
jgi:LacI family transcriptional regulator